MIKKILIGALIVVLLLAGGGLIYLNLDQYQAQLATNYALESDGNTLYKLNSSSVGFIFYQGGKVENEAYSYLSQVNANVFLLDTPFNLSIFTINAAAEIIDQYQEITTWYVGGHSLGGSTAFLFANNADVKIEGIVYLGSYPTEVNQFKQLAIFGDQDGLLNYQDYLNLFDQDDTIIIISGGNHANFGEYGPQTGDNQALIEPASQRLQVIEAINLFIGGNQ